MSHPWRPQPWHWRLRYQLWRAWFRLVQAEARLEYRLLRRRCG